MTHRVRPALFLPLVATIGCEFGFLPDINGEQQAHAENERLAPEPDYPSHYSPEQPENWLHLYLAQTPEPPFRPLFSCQGDCPDYLGSSAYCFEDASGYTYCPPTPSNLTHDHTCLYGHDGYGFCYPNSCGVPDENLYAVDECADDPLTQNYRYCVELRTPADVAVGNVGTCPFPQATLREFSFSACEEDYGQCVSEAFSMCTSATECLDGQWYCSEAYYECLWEGSPCDAAGASSAVDGSIVASQTDHDSCATPADCETGLDACFLAVDNCRSAAPATYGCESHLQFCEKWLAWCSAPAEVDQ